MLSCYILIYPVLSFLSYLRSLLIFFSTRYLNKKLESGKNTRSRQKAISTGWRLHWVRWRDSFNLDTILHLLSLKLIGKEHDIEAFVQQYKKAIVQNPRHLWLARNTFALMYRNVWKPKKKHSFSLCQWDKFSHYFLARKSYFPTTSDNRSPLRELACFNSLSGQFCLATDLFL